MNQNRWVRWTKGLAVMTAGIPLITFLSCDPHGLGFVGGSGFDSFFPFGGHDTIFYDDFYYEEWFHVDDYYYDDFGYTEFIFEDY